MISSKGFDSSGRVRQSFRNSFNGPIWKEDEILAKGDKTIQYVSVKSDQESSQRKLEEYRPGKLKMDKISKNFR